MSTTGSQIIQSLTEFTEHVKEKPVTRTKRLPCGRTKAELAKDKKRLLKLVEISEAAERGEVIEYRCGPIDSEGWKPDTDLRLIAYADFQYRIAKPKRGAK